MGAAKLDVVLLTHTEDPLAIIYTAYRQCYGKDAADVIFSAAYDGGSVPEDVQKDFIGKVLESGHDSQIEHVSMSFSISGVSRALTHQLVRHRLASYGHQSQRYVDANGFDYILPPNIAAIPEARDRFIRAMEESAQAYDEIQKILITNGLGSKANEDARFVLPNACETKIVVTMNCRSLLHFFSLRCCMRAQWEIRLMANRMLDQCKKVLPSVFESAGANCVRLGYCPEIKKFSCGMMPTLKELIEERSGNQQ